MHYPKSKTKEIIFPLGGIGTGCVGIAGNGGFRDWEIFNRPNKGSYNGCSHLAVKAEWGGKTAVKVLTGDLCGGLMGEYQKTLWSGYGFGPVQGTMAGFSHFRRHDFTGDFPFARLRFSDDAFPCRMALEAFNPFTPGCSFDSSLPCAIFNVTFENTTDEEMTVTGALSVRNPYPRSKNEAVPLAGASAVTLCNAAGDGNMTIAAVGTAVGAQEYWYRGRWMDGIATFWRQFSDGDLPKRRYGEPSEGDTATVFAKAAVKPHGKATVRFLLTWYHPVRENDWDDKAVDENGKRLTFRNWYATAFDSSLDVARYVNRHHASLRKRSADFARAFRNSTLPEEVKDAATANLSVLKSPTVLRLEDGTFWGFEGVHEKVGSCEGTCTHVWNYAYALCYLFPDLERSIREADYRYNLRPSGLMRFRLPLPPTEKGGWEMPCVDGQMGGVIKTYRDWKLSGDTEWLRSLWEKVKRSLDFATSPDNPFRWDADADGVLEGRQHHTLDMELFGPSSWLEGFYLAALKAGSEMARALGDTEAAERWEELFTKGCAFTEEELFNGRYYIQKVDLSDRSRLARLGEDAVRQYWNEEAGEMKYQIGEGSEIDQLVAQWHAALCGLPDVFDREHRRSALRYMFEHNFKPSVRDMTNTWRVFVTGGEGGAVICDYAGAYKPVLPIPYTEECMHGFEYAFAGLLISEGFVAEGLQIVRAVRDRYDGAKRNPYNEMECGSNYARSMASYALVPLLSGFTFDYTKHAVGFAPVGEPETFRAPFGVGGAFATVSLAPGSAEIRVLSGSLTLSTLSLPETVGKVSTVSVDGTPVAFRYENGTLRFETPVIVKKYLQIKR